MPETGGQVLDQAPAVDQRGGVGMTEDMHSVLRHAANFCALIGGGTVPACTSAGFHTPRLKIDR
ncbi:hypothetical protein GCM10009760_62250 [Kitasatospora kazusensis]|uniref:Uncharacterized protein n=1 Tax=Kitasatospora kazusensis TaxID=407974 RepID=A0ABP4KDH4_9ACTN